MSTTTELPGISTTISANALGRLGAGTGNRVVLLGSATDATGEKNTLKRFTKEEDLSVLGTGDLYYAARRFLKRGMSSIEVYAVDSLGNNDAFGTLVETILADPKPIEVLGVVDVTNAGQWSTMADKLDGAAARHQYTVGVVRVREPGDNDADWVADLEGERGSIKNNRLQIVAGSLNLADRSESEPLLFSYLPLLASRAAHEAPDAVKYGPIPLAQARVPASSIGELKGLKNAGYVTAREYYGIPGVYITLACIASDATSDFDTVEKIRVMHRACRMVRTAQMRFVNDVVSTTPEGLEMFKSMCELPLEQMKRNGEITAYEVGLNNIEDIIRDNKIRVRIRIVPLGKLQYIENEISFATTEDLA